MCMCMCMRRQGYQCNDWQLSRVCGRCVCVCACVRVCRCLSCPSCAENMDVADACGMDGVRMLDATFECRTRHG